MPIQFYNQPHKPQELQEQRENTYSRAAELIEIIGVMLKYSHYDMYDKLEMKCLIMILKYLVEYTDYLSDGVHNPPYDAWLENAPECMSGNIEFVEHRLNYITSNIGITDYCEAWIMAYRDITVDYIQFFKWLYECPDSIYQVQNSKKRDSEVIAILDKLDEQYRLLGGKSF